MPGGVFAIEAAYPPVIATWSMNVRYGPFNITTFLAMACTLWIIVARLRGMTDSNGPLIYLIGIVAYSMAFPGCLEPRFIYVGSVAALFLRFEFMGGAFMKFVRLVDFLVLLYFLYSFATVLIL
ncbi:MAG: hypothetical protein KIT09_14945 [Bryobacteraceae bacterium]|nr:hypothetical protein [Bryobacteraceae bacterium]